MRGEGWMISTWNPNELRSPQDMQSSFRKGWQSFKRTIWNSNTRSPNGADNGGSGNESLASAARGHQPSWERLSEEFQRQSDIRRSERIAAAEQNKRLTTAAKQHSKTQSHKARQPSGKLSRSGSRKSAKTRRPSQAEPQKQPAKVKAVRTQTEAWDPSETSPPSSGKKASLETLTSPSEQRQRPTVQTVTSSYTKVDKVSVGHTKQNGETTAGYSSSSDDEDAKPLASFVQPKPRVASSGGYWQEPEAAENDRRGFEEPRRGCSPGHGQREATPLLPEATDEVAEDALLTLHEQSEQELEPTASEPSEEFHQASVWSSESRFLAGEEELEQKAPEATHSSKGRMGPLLAMTVVGLGVVLLGLLAIDQQGEAQSFSWPDLDAGQDGLSSSNEPTDSMEKFRQMTKGLKSRAPYPGLPEDAWLATWASMRRLLEGHSSSPSGDKAEASRCFAKKLALAANTALGTASGVEDIDLGSVQDVMGLDAKLRQALAWPSRVAVLGELEGLGAKAARLLHGYADSELPTVPGAALFFSLRTDQAPRDKVACRQTIRQRLREAWPELGVELEPLISRLVISTLCVPSSFSQLC